MSKSSPRILRVRRSDPTDDLPPYALVSIISSKGARNALDLKLLATEGENAFVTTLKHDKINELKGKTYSGSDTEWKAILSRTLLYTSLTETKIDASTLQGLEVVCSVPNTETLIITWQRTKRTSTQILGSVSLSQTEDEQIDPFLWAGDAIQASDAIADQVETLEKQLRDERSTTDKLKAQLKDLVAAKEEHEQALLAKFVELLNAKKLKIRDQQRLLAGAKIDSTAVDQVTSSAGRQAAPTSSRKRTNADASSSDDGDDSDAFENVSAKAATESPVQSDIDSDAEREPTPPPKAVVRRVIGGSKSKQAASKTSQSPAKQQKSPPAVNKKPARVAHKADSDGQSEDAAFDNQPPPKRRELPFQRKADPLPAPTPVPVPELEAASEAQFEDEKMPTPAVTRWQANEDEDVMDEDSDTEEEL